MHQRVSLQTQKHADFSQMHFKARETNKNRLSAPLRPLGPLLLAIVFAHHRISLCCFTISPYLQRLTVRFAGAELKNANTSTALHYEMHCKQDTTPPPPFPNHLCQYRGGEKYNVI